MALCGLAACSPEAPKDCPSVATFSVYVSASKPLPDDLILKVRSGGGMESYAIKQPPESKVVFCYDALGRALTQFDSADAAADAGADFSVIRCDLWTAGAAMVSIEATGYDRLERELASEADDGCTRTVAVHLMLDAPDAAP